LVSKSVVPRWARWADPGVPYWIWRCKNRGTWDTPLSCGPWNDCKEPSKNAMECTYPTPRSGPGSKAKVSDGASRRVGSMNPRSMILSSWKKGADCRRVCLATYQDSRYRRVGTAGSQASEWVRHDASVWVHGAFEPATGEATLVVSGKRDSASHIQLLEKVIHILLNVC
jgi:hypothetical protein